ncbi:jg26374 [Pararge aegeria aegeria]|uniref:Jg26374 protein n=1 Tax=Pararge aegeria aegeria TaxID=348720 RepID=A0A8S4QDM8_9NEOP|nr:jg26374 [Pararge aegeria aegeria]
MPTSPARGAPCRLTDEALATDKWWYNHFELARLNKWHRPVSGSSDAGAISLALRSPTRLPSVVIIGHNFNGKEEKTTAPSSRRPRYSWLQTTLSASQVAAGSKRLRTMEFGTPCKRPMSSSEEEALV